MDRRDGLIAFELDFDTAAEGEELREWIVEGAELPLLQLFEAGDVATGAPGGAVRFFKGEGGWACVVCENHCEAVALIHRFCAF